ncbi:MAG: hypothetical protein B7Z50_05495 [Sphingomonadales bacterium 12-62-5]|nr:MAG: hypothetical protein B7Z50_05495 [Sphingomonadales bacterium 12-62-5]
MQQAARFHRHLSSLDVHPAPERPVTLNVWEAVYFDHDLDRLVEQVRETGLAVSVVRTGTTGPLPPGAGLSVYRIVQEAVVNASMMVTALMPVAD